MSLSKKGKYVFGGLIAIILLFIAKPMYDSGHGSKGIASDMYNFSGRTYVCGIDLGDDMKGGHGLETGLAYEIVKSFANTHNCNISIRIAKRRTNYLDSLQQGKIDMLIMHLEDLKSAEEIIISDSLTDCCAIALAHEKSDHIDELNNWIAEYTQSEEYLQLRDIFGRINNPIKLAEKGIRRDRLCPYDDLMKQYAKDLGWDWRMLAAVVYQESKFSISSHSHRGATGLMQVMPRTARHYDIHDLHDPEQNLIAGTSHLKRLQNLYKNSGMTQQERIHFTLAAYNAGEGRVMDCRNLAKSQNLDHNRWDDVIKVIPMMSVDSILTDENVKLGKFKGTETIAYVENVMNLYNAICKVCPNND